MMRLRYLFYAALLCVLPYVAYAESARWAIRPQYTSIVNFGEDFFKVKSGGKTGILDKDGNTVVSVSADSITDPVEGYSLVLNLEKDMFKLVGILDSYGSFKKIDKDWYVGDFPFFSESKLPVCNKSGKYGFIDTSGKLVIKFSYGSVHPFCEGYAAVSKGKSLLEEGFGSVVKLFGSKKKDKVFYINNLGIPLDLQSDIGDVYLATSFRNGKALVINMNEKRCVIDTSGRLVSLEDSGKPLVFDDKYVLTDKKGANGRVVKSAALVANGPVPYMSGGLYGYKYNGRVVLPAQFVSADSFHNGSAIVRTVVGVGVLRLTMGNFQCVRNAGTDKAPDSSMESVNYVVYVPEEWKSGVFEMQCKGSNGMEYKSAGTNKDGYLHFPFILPKGMNKCDLVDTQGNLVLWRTPALLDSSLKISVAAGKTTKKGTAPVTVTLTNNGAERLKFNVTVYGEGIENAEALAELGSGQTKTVTTFASGINSSSARTVTVSVNEETTTRQVYVDAYKPERKSAKRRATQQKRNTKKNNSGGKFT